MATWIERVHGGAQASEIARTKAVLQGEAASLRKGKLGVWGGQRVWSLQRRLSSTLKGGLYGSGLCPGSLIFSSAKRDRCFSHKVTLNT